MTGVLIGILEKNSKNNMDEETFEQAKENDLTLEEAEDLQEFKDETELEGEEALEVWQEL